MLKFFTGSLGNKRLLNFQNIACLNNLKFSQLLSSSILLQPDRGDNFNKDSMSGNPPHETDLKAAASNDDNEIKPNFDEAKHVKKRKERHRKKNKSESGANNQTPEKDPNSGGQQRTPNKNRNSQQQYTPNKNNQHQRTPNKNRDSNPNTPRKTGQKSHNLLPEMKFEPYISLEECSEKLEHGELVKSSIRINPRAYTESFANDPAGLRDINISGMENRNRAMNGDIVAVEIFPEDQWKYKDDVLIAKTGKVVSIIDKKHCRIAAGHLNLYKSNAFGFALMCPVDSRVPRIMIPINECPKDFTKRPKDFEKTLFVASIYDWGLNLAFASGKLLRSIGEAGHIEPETEAIIASNDIDSSDFKEDVLRCLPDGETWEITKEELSKRKDLRGECIFTIDPATARDLDDALSCKKIGDDLYEVGVHIADVSHFIEQENALDEIAQNRATSVYLAQRVIPMLPRVLCEQLCSLNPGVERLAYSVIWNIKSDGTIVKEWFGRSVIKSCVKLSYDHAQQMIDAEVSDLNAEDYPQIYGDFPIKKITGIVKNLYGISAHLRKNRFDSGALKIDMPKLAFTLDDESKMPNGCRVYQYKNSNEMIEEFMLLANMAVGRKIYKSHPKIAILRNHPPPQEVMMHDLQKICETFNIAFDIRDSASINKSLRNVLIDYQDKEELYNALTLMCAKPFQNAKYFCTGSIEDEAAYRHYALNVPIYTHFTSPIRRYPDIMVHRLLTAALKSDFKVQDDVKALQAVADHCNDKKWAAKKASEQSSLLFFAVYIKECGPVTEKGVVVGILNRAVDVLCTRLGVVNRVYIDQLSLLKHDFNNEENEQTPRMTLHWIDDSKTQEGSLDDKLAALTQQFEKKWQAQKEETEDNPNANESEVITQELTIFTPVNLVLSVKDDSPTKIIASLTNPHKVDDNPQLGL